MISGLHMIGQCRCGNEIRWRNDLFVITSLGQQLRDVVRGTQGVPTSIGCLSTATAVACWYARLAARIHGDRVVTLTFVIRGRIEFLILGSNHLGRGDGVHREVSWWPW